MAVNRLVVALVALGSVLGLVQATFYPYPGITHADHDDDHRGYFLTMRQHELLPAVSVETATAALTAYLYQLTAMDDIIVFGAFFDNSTRTYLTSSLWRTESGAARSFSTALSAANYHLFLSQTQYYGGTVANFFENGEVHSAVELGLYRQLRISALKQPEIWNSSNIPAIVQEHVLPVAQGLPGAIDYTTTYPTAPFADVFWLTEKTYSNASIFTRENSQLEPTIQTYLGDKLYQNTFFEGVISAFWHSAPGLTDPLPNGVTAPKLPPAPGTGAGCTLSGASALSAASPFVLLSALLLSLALVAFN